MKMSKEGYDYEVVGEVCEDFLCPICLMLLRDAIELPCSHTMCDFCTNKWTDECKNRSAASSCPKCKKEYSMDDVRCNRAFDRLITTTITVRCKKSNEGCPWSGVISNIKDHDELCDFTVVKCTFEGCPTMVKRVSIATHQATCLYRKTDCDYCKEELPVIFVEEHLKVCQFYPLRCPLQGCNDTIQRNELEYHIINICLHQTIKCTFEAVGCNVLTKRCESEVHEKENLQTHMRLLLQNSMEMKSENERLKKEMAQQNEMIVNYNLQNKTLKVEMAQQNKKREKENETLRMEMAQQNKKGEKENKALRMEMAQQNKKGEKENKALRMEMAQQNKKREKENETLKIKMTQQNGKMEQWKRKFLEEYRGNKTQENSLDGDVDELYSEEEVTSAEVPTYRFRQRFKHRIHSSVFEH